MEKQKKVAITKGWCILIAILSVVSLMGVPSIASLAKMSNVQISISGSTNNPNAILDDSPIISLTTKTPQPQLNTPSGLSPSLPNDRGTTRYVGSGGGVNYTTIQAAIDASGPGDTIFVYSGIYDGTLNIDTKSDLLIIGQNKATTIIKSSTTLPWNVGGYGSSRQTVVRVVFSTKINITGFTIDFILVAGNKQGMLYWDSTGLIDNNILKNIQYPDASGGYGEITFYARAVDSPYNDGNRAHITISNNEFIDTGRVGIVTHDWVDVTVNQNIFYKTVDDFGYAMEIGSASIGQITHNTIYNYDTPAVTDGSSASGIYIENSFTSGISGVTKTVLIEDNDIYGCQYGLTIGNQFAGYAGDVDIVVNLNNNLIRDSHSSSITYASNGGAIITDEGKDAGSSVTLHSHGNTISNNGPDGGYFIYAIDNGAITATIEEDTFINNGVDGDDAGGIYVNDYGTVPIGSSYDIIVNYCVFSGNHANGIQNDYAGTTIHAAYNYWGDANGPSAGDGVSGLVDYYPHIDTNPPWAATLNFKKQGDPRIWDTAIFGEKIDASDGQDKYDVPKPGTPPNPYIITWFDAGLQVPYNNLWEDYRHFPHEDQVWDLYVRANTNPPSFATNVVISWNTAAINASEYTHVDLYDESDVFLADMNTQSSYTLTAPDDTNIHLKIKCHVNQVPIITDIPNQTIAEGSSFATINLDDYVSDVDNTDAQMTWTYSGNTALTVSIVDRVATITIPSADWNGAETITFKATDPDGLYDDDAATFTVTAVNDPPVVTDIPDQTIAEGSTFTTISLDNYVSDVDNTDAEMTWTYSGNSQLSVSIVDRIATITIPNADWNGAETITFRATDPLGQWDDDAVTFTVTAVNDPPIVTDIPDQTVAEGSTFATISLDNYVSDVDNTDAEMIWTYSGNTALTVSIVDRVATISIPNADWNGAETITFRATDPGSLFDDDAATFTVTAVNDPPVVTDIPDQTIAEGSTFTTISLDDYVSDVDNTDAQMTWTYSGNLQLTVNIDSNRIATITIPSADWSGAETITFRATDPGALYDEDSATFTVIQLHSINVKAHWNLISLPVYDTTSKANIVVRYGGHDHTWAQAVSELIVLDTLYDWQRGSTQAYAPTSTLVPGNGYWMWAYFDCELLIPSNAVGTGHITDLQTKWNIMGLPYEDSLVQTLLKIEYPPGTTLTWAEAVAGNVILGFIYGWDSTTQMYALKTTFEPGQGYWMYAYYDCILKK